MPRDMFSKYGLDKIHDSMTEDHDYKDNDPTQWELVETKRVLDSDGFLTDYAWYTNGEKHIFMFGDTELYEPDEDYADHVVESTREATSWFDNYTGFTEDDFDMYEIVDEEDSPEGDADFMNEGFLRVYAEGLNLED